MKTYQHGYYSILLCFDSMLSYNTSVQNNEFMKRRNQNQKFSFPFFAGSPHTPRRKWIGKEIFGFVHATTGSVRGAQDWRWQAIGAYASCSALPRTRSVRSHLFWWAIQDLNL